MLNHALLVDDSKSARFALRKLLERNGLRVDIAENAEEALGYLNDHRPDVIFMDHFMPGMDGFEAVKIIKTQPGTASIPVVMCTSKDGDAYTAEAHAIGASDILAKPATPDSLDVVLGRLSEAANEEIVVDEPLDAAANMTPEQLFEQIIDVPDTSESESESESYSQSIVQAEVQSPEPVKGRSTAEPVMPPVEKVAAPVPVEEIERIAAESAQTVIEREINERVDRLLAEKVPEMREMVMANFDSVIRSMLKGYIDEAMSQAKQNFSEVVRNESRQMADEVSREVVESAVKTQVLSVEETLHRETNESLAEVYSSIGELKANQDLEKVSPELDEKLEASAREVNQKIQSELSETFNRRFEDKERAFRTETAEANQKIQSELSETLNRRLDDRAQAVRTETAETVWKKIEESQQALSSKILKAKFVAIAALLVAVGAVAASFIL